MSHIKTNSSFSPIVRSLDGMMKEFFNEFPSTVSKTFREDVLHFPPVNIVETDTQYRLDLLVPGYEKSDFSLKLEDNILSVRAEQKEETQTESDKMIRKEFSMKAFKRSFTLDDKVDTTHIEAKYENGVLKLVLPKKESATPTTKEIEIL